MGDWTNLIPIGYIEKLLGWDLKLNRYIKLWAKFYYDNLLFNTTAQEEGVEEADTARGGAILKLRWVEEIKTIDKWGGESLQVLCHAKPTLLW